jgi:hypothetical protein
MDQGQSDKWSSGSSKLAPMGYSNGTYTAIVFGSSVVPVLAGPTGQGRATPFCHAIFCPNFRATKNLTQFFRLASMN